MSKVTEIEKEIRELESKLLSVEEEIVRVEQDIRGLESRKARLLTEEALGTLKSKKDLEDTKVNLAKLRELLEDKQMARDGLKETILLEEESLRKEKIRALYLECDEIESAYAIGAEEVKELERKLSRLREKGTELHKRWDSLQVEIGKLDGEMKDGEKVFGLQKIYSNIS